MESELSTAVTFVLRGSSVKDSWRAYSIIHFLSWTDNPLGAARVRVLLLLPSVIRVVVSD